MLPTHMLHIVASTLQSTRETLTTRPIELLTNRKVSVTSGALKETCSNESEFASIYPIPLSGLYPVLQIVHYTADSHEASLKAPVTVNGLSVFERESLVYEYILSAEWNRFYFWIQVFRIAHPHIVQAYRYMFSYLLPLFLARTLF